uniref:Uncharacterized protein n=1 Tax=Paramormyrops kingsleyae TaxID=1676925 RepID=A0A3B3SWT5_9TELE
WMALQTRHGLSVGGPQDWGHLTADSRPAFCHLLLQTLARDHPFLGSSLSQLGALGHPPEVRLVPLPPHCLIGVPLPPRCLIQVPLPPRCLIRVPVPPYWLIQVPLPPHCLIRVPVPPYWLIQVPLPPHCLIGVPLPPHLIVLVSKVCPVPILVLLPALRPRSSRNVRGGVW